jgi:nitrogen regulatory protein A
MTAVVTEWEDRLAKIRELTASDFCAAAHFDASSRRIRWFAASGNKNERFLKMVKRPGEGVAGEAIRFGRMIHRTYKEDEQVRTDDYILHAERLLVAAAAPAGGESNAPRGILLIGRRSSAAYDSREIRLLEEAAATLFQDATHELYKP